MNTTQKAIKSVEDKLRRRQSNKSKTPPKNTVRQPNIVPLDIMDINTVTQSTTLTSILKKASSTTASKTRSKTVQFSAIVDVQEIECNSKLKMKTAKMNKQKINNSNKNKFGNCPL